MVLGLAAKKKAKKTKKTKKTVRAIAPVFFAALLGSGIFISAPALAFEIAEFDIPDSADREHFNFARSRPRPIGVSPASQAAGAATRTKLSGLVFYKSEMLPADRSAAARQAFEEAVQLYRQGTPESLQGALKKLEEASSLYRELGDRAGTALILRSIGQIYIDSKEPSQALDYYQEALTIYRELGDVSSEGATLNNIAIAYNDLGKPREALDYFEEALERSRLIGFAEGEAIGLGYIGWTYHLLGEQQPALEFSLQALSRYREIKQPYGEAQTLSNIARIYSTIDDVERSIEFYNQSSSMYRELGDKAREAQVLKAIGNLRYKLGEREQALETYSAALAVVRGANDPLTEASILYSIARVHLGLGDQTQGLEYLNQSLPLYRAANNIAGEAVNFNAIGVAYAQLGEKREALIYFEKALDLYREAGDRNGELSTINNIGNIYYLLDETEPALDYFKQALALFRETGDRFEEGYILLNIGNAYADMGETRQALDNYKQALSINREVGNRVEEASSLNHIGSIYLQLGNLERAEEYYNQALPLKRETGDRPGLANSLKNLARLNRASGNLAEALSKIEAAIEIIEDLRAQIDRQDFRTSFFAFQQQYYELYIDLLMDLHREKPSQGYDAKALQASERARARTLVELLQEAGADIRAGVNPELRERESNLQQRINIAASRQSQLLSRKSGDSPSEEAEALKQELDNLFEELEQVRAKIRQSSPRYAALTQPQPLSLAEIQTQVLDEDTLLLEYFLGEERSYLWVATKTSIASYELPGREEIENAARNFRNYLTAPTLRIRRQKVAEATAALSEMILGPVASQLASQLGDRQYDRLLIVSDGALQYVPFAALSLPKSRNQTADSQASAAKPLIVDYEIVNLPSASTLAVLRRYLPARETSPQTVAILADPVFSLDDERVTGSEPKNPNSENPGALERAAKAAGINWNRLPGTRQEAEAIMALVPESERKQVFDFEATRERAISSELSQYRILHFATHGFANSENPELSGIVMSLVDERGDRQNGYLRLHDIYNLDLGAELVVLSACQTGLGEEIRGEGLVGLTRGFMYAGAPRVVVSLWSVDDKATAELMGIFYQKMLEEKLAPAAALRAAQIQMWQQKEWQIPYYWAAFGLQGEWR